jgi:cytochrome c-type biogenesis protein CcmH
MDSLISMRFLRIMGRLRTSSRHAGFGAWTLTAWLSIVVMLIAAAPARAVDATPPLPTPQLQQRYLALTHELRCMQCQDESLADSEVNLAGQMRGEVHDLLLQGLSDQQVRDYLVSRYGEFILFKPPMNWRNAWLWVAPTVLMLVGLGVGAGIIAQRRKLVAQDGDEPSDDTLDEHWQA